MYNAEFRRALENCDIEAVRKIWNNISPHLPQPKTDQEVLATIHMARTSSNIISLKLRAYSHRWLLDNEYPSLLPDNLKPKAERLYPKIVDSVGISVNSKSELFAPIMPLVRTAMSDSVLESYADKVTDPIIIKQNMFRAKKETVKKLLGIRDNSN